MHRLSGIASARLAVLAASATGRTSGGAGRGRQRALRHHLQSWLEVVEQEPGPDRRRILEVAAHFTPDDLAVPLAELEEHLSVFGLGELASWPAAARSASLAEIESYRQLVVLMTELNQQFVEIPAARTLKSLLL